MNLEIEKLIDLALADGIVTEQERAIILRKAEKLGEDIDEVEMILDGKIALMNKEKNQLSTQKSNKEGDLKKCPSCGAPVESFNTKCSECGHEFKNIETSNSVKLFFLKMNELESQRSDDTLVSSLSSAMSASVFGGESKVDRQKRS